MLPGPPAPRCSASARRTESQVPACLPLIASATMLIAAGSCCLKDWHAAGSAAGSKGCSLPSPQLSTHPPAACPLLLPPAPVHPACSGGLLQRAGCQGRGVCVGGGEAGGAVGGRGADAGAARAGGRPELQEEHALAARRRWASCLHSCLHTYAPHALRSCGAGGGGDHAAS